MKIAHLIYVLFLLCVAGGCGGRRVTVARPVRAFDAKTLYEDYRQLPGTVAMHRPSPEETSAVLGREDLASTREIVPRDWPTDGGSIRFLYEPNGGQYWGYRVNRMVAGDSEWLVGPFDLPGGR